MSPLVTWFSSAKQNPPGARWRNSRRITLPVVVIGNAGTNSTSRGYSCAASRVYTCSWMAFAKSPVGAKPSFSTMKAFTISVRTSSDLPTTPAI